jgi:hypothetical protein
MEFKEIHLSCECGALPISAPTIGLTALHQLLIHWVCPKCKQQVYFLKTLAECWRDCPVSAADEVTPFDRRFLRTMGVKDPQGDA